MQYPCPECGTVLRPKNPLTAGKKVKCPKCATIFAPVNDKADEEEEGSYGFSQADEEAERATAAVRKKAMGPLKERPKSSRGPAQAAVTPPSNKMLGTAVITCVGCVLTVLVVLWPIVFSSSKKADELSQKVSRKKVVEETPEQKTAKIVWGVFVLSMAVLSFFYNGAVGLAAVKMQSLESYAWAMMGSFLVMLPFNWVLAYFSFYWFIRLVTSIAPDEYAFMLIALTVGGVSFFYVYVGLWNLKTLRTETVVAGFREEKPKDM